MIRFSRRIAKYIFQAIVPYFAFAWLLLSVILFVQQASRYTDIFFGTNVPTKLVWQLTLALIPNVIAFTCPMAVLVGAIIGFSKIRGDSELTAIRAAGVGNFQIAVPVIFLGLLLSAFAFTVNLRGVPLAAQVIRKVALQTALYKLESPIEPGVFNTEIQGFTVYVKNGDIDNGTWKNIFIYNEDKKTNQTRLITSKDGRLDSSEDVSELVLNDALVTTFSNEKPYRNLTSEKSGNFRLVIQTKRGELINRISKTEESPEEMGLMELASYAESKSGKEKTEAKILWQRRIVLSVTPLIFALLGASLVLRFNRGGRGFGIFLALVSLVIYYLVTLLGEQLARTNKINIAVSSLLPVALTCSAIIWLFLSQRLFLTKRAGNVFSRFKIPVSYAGLRPRSNLIGIKTGILDFDIISNLLRYFLLTLSFLTIIYLIFTAFELWKFAGNINGGTSILTKYLIFLIPFVYIQISPSALMIATLATYVIKSRQNEVVTWTASGQSIYRLLFPCFILMLLIGIFNRGIQERVLPQTNQIQDALRAQIRNQGVRTDGKGKYWVANENRIYSFQLPDTDRLVNDRRQVSDLTVYQFTDDGARLQSLVKTGTASWERGKIRLTADVEETVWNDGVPQTTLSGTSQKEIAESYNPFLQAVGNSNHLNSSDTSEQLKNAESESEQRNLSVALQKKYATPFLPLIVTFFTAPFALSLSRKGKVLTIGYAVGLWLLFTGVSSTFEQFGTSGYLDPKVAVWSPLVVFTIIGAYLISRVRT